MTHILVVDDWPDICAVVEEALTPEGFRVSCKSHPIAAIALVESETPDIALVDVLLPGIPGLDLAAFLVEREIPVVLMTGAAALGHSLDDAGFPILQKPFRIAELVRQTRETIASSREGRERCRRALAEVLGSRDRLVATAARLEATAAELKVKA